MATDPEIYPGRLQRESRFFAPTPRCPDPGYWWSTDGDSTEREVSELIGALVRACQPEFVLETGAAFGGTTKEIVKAINRNGHGSFVTLETDPARAAHVREHVPAKPWWTLIETSSLEWLPTEYPPIGLLFSDTERDIRTQEVLRYLPYMRRGAIVAVHDSAWDVGAIRGWLENSIVKPGLGRAIDLPTPRGLTLLEMKPGDGR